MSSNQVFVFIPYIKPTMNEQDVIRVFDELDLGKISYIDMHNKTNERKQVYQFAFIRFEAYNTSEGNRVAANAARNLSTRIHYDINDLSVYLEIKPYLSFESRCARKEEIPEAFESELDPDCNEIFDLCLHLSSGPNNKCIGPSFFTQDACEEINQEYEDLQKEIDQLMAAPVYSIWTTPLLFVQ